MPETRIRGSRPRATNSNGCAEAGVALIAAEAGVRARIGEALGTEGWDLTEFESVEGLNEGLGGNLDGRGTGKQMTPEAVVVWIDDAESSPARQVELLRESLGETPIVAVCEGIERWEIRATHVLGEAWVAFAERPVGVRVERKLHAWAAGRASSHACAASGSSSPPGALDTTGPITKGHLTRRITKLNPQKMNEVCAALNRAVDC